METRSKKKCKLSAVKDGDTSLNSTREYYLPPEILEIIIGYLQEDAKELMKYRLVNSHWASVVKTYIERKILSNWMSWNNGLRRTGDPVFYLYTRENPPEPFPMLSLVSAASLPNARSAAVYTPIKFGVCGNPFPTGSLTIHLETPHNPEDYYQKMKTWNHSMEPWKVEKLLCNFGEHLTSFVFQDATVTFLQLEIIMKSLLNLKAVSISKITLAKKSKTRVGSKTSLIPIHLTHIKAVEKVAPQIIQWLVDRCSYQLISLDVDASALKPLRQHPTPSPVPYQKLKYLKVHNPSYTFLRLTECEFFPLKYLSVISEKTGRFENHISLGDIVKFAGLFPKTLVELNIYLDWNALHCKPTDWEVDHEADGRFVKKFTKLGQFAFRVPEWLKLTLLNYFQPCKPQFKYRAEMTIGVNRDLIFVYTKNYFKPFNSRFKTD